MKKVLGVSNPPIIGYTIHALPISIIMNYKECLPWFYSNYIQLVCNPNHKDVFLDFLTLCPIFDNNYWIEFLYPGIPWLNKNCIEEYVFYKNNLDINEFIIQSINSENYIITALDEYYIPYKKSYQINHYLHDYLIFGYDSEEKEYDILGFDNSHHFGKSKINFDVISNTFNNSHERKINGVDKLYYNPIKLLKINEDFSFILDLQLIKNFLIDYLESKNSFIMFRSIRNITNNLMYGISIYDELIKYFQNDDNKESYDIRALHILWEHKKCMLLRLDYIINTYNLKEFDDIYKEFKYIEKQCMKLRNLLIKFYITKM
ncbi:hypothetical protein [Anaerocolumna jejuensis]|uniref:hypothetical protein n=1 Tax=Anaerocolumna jejuensis TaxID=259063 RepID=UPI003F7C314C